MPEVATPNQGEREFETGTDESFKNANATGSAAHNENQRVTYANIKRTYDVYQDLDIQAARQSLIEQTRLNQIASQALQNAVETANMIGKQAVRHADVAADALWTDELNPVTRGAGSNLTAGAVPANRATDVSAAGVGRGCPGRGRRRCQAGGRHHHAGARHPAADRTGHDHREHGDRQRRQSGAAEDGGVADPSESGRSSGRPNFSLEPKSMNTLLIILKIFPLVLAAVQAVEQAIPLPGQGNKKLELVLAVLKSAYDGSTDLAKQFSWDKLVAVVVPMIGKIVDLHNALGLFQKAPQTKNV